MVERRLRVAIVGAQRARVAKVLSLLMENEESCIIHVPDTNDTICIEYLPCVATFDFYENEQGNQIRYLSKVEYHGADGQQRGESLAQFFDEEEENKKNGDLPEFPGISAVAIGCGIESPQDVNMIETLIQGLSGQQNDEREESPILVECVSPNKEYSNMKQETEAYKVFSLQEKESITKAQTMGPGKMAKFVLELAKSFVGSALQTSSDTTTAGEQTASLNKSTNQPSNVEEEPSTQEPLVIDPNKTRYACRTCRTILFGEDHLEDPKHVPQLHTFSRKSHYGNSSQCGSLFLRDGLDWMGDITCNVEGKFSCPRCNTKIGSYKWAGTQCSCGTWVTPAIQVPLGKVDKVNPYSSKAPPGTILSPTVVGHAQPST